LPGNYDGSRTGSVSLDCALVAMVADDVPEASLTREGSSAR
jgi:mRNA-degrading endonuclease YafQ of YafQ-DinJ toxin-antitoxin module